MAQAPQTTLPSTTTPTTAANSAYKLSAGADSCPTVSRQQTGRRTAVWPENHTNVVTKIMMNTRHHDDENFAGYEKSERERETGREKKESEGKEETKSARHANECNVDKRQFRPRLKIN